MTSRDSCNPAKLLNHLKLHETFSHSCNYFEILNEIINIYLNINNKKCIYINIYSNFRPTFIYNNLMSAFLTVIVRTMVLKKNLCHNQCHNLPCIIYNYFRQIWSQTYQDLTSFCVKSFGHSHRR